MIRLADHLFKEKQNVAEQAALAGNGDPMEQVGSSLGQTLSQQQTQESKDSILGKLSKTF